MRLFAVGSEVKKFLVRSKFIVLRSREDDEDEAAAEVTMKKTKMKTKMCRLNLKKMKR